MNAISLSFHKEMAKEKEPKGLMPFGFPQRANVAAFHSAHICAKFYIFSFCVGVLKKNANTEVTRKQKKKKLLLSATHPGSTNFLTKTISLPSPAARDDKAARDAE
jgi:hypothetical protein